MLTVKEITERDKECSAKPFAGSEFALKVCSRHLSGGAYTMSFQNTDVTLEIRIKGRKYRHGNIKHFHVFHEVAVIVGKLVYGENHVVKGEGI